VSALDAATAPLLRDPTDRAAAGAASGPAGIAAGLVANALAAARDLGSTETSAVVLRSDLTRLLVSRTYLAASVPGPAAVGRTDPGSTGPGRTDAGRTDAPDVLARRLVARLVPGEDGLPVLAGLRAGNAALAGAAEAGDRPGATAAGVALAAADRDLSARLARAVPALPADLVLRELDLGRGPLLAAVRARAAGDEDAVRLLVLSARQAPVTAAVLAAGLADQHGLR